MEQTVDQYLKIKGWGVDANPKTRPYYPVHKTQHNTGAHWLRPAQQKIDMEILRSRELNKMPAVFGTSVAPSGLSGIIRRIAYKFSENQYLHWLPLLIADRINVIEGVIDDLAHGHIPNLVAEMGYGASYKYDRKLFSNKAAKAMAVVTVPASILYDLINEINNETNKETKE